MNKRNAKNYTTYAAACNVDDDITVNLQDNFVGFSIVNYEAISMDDMTSTETSLTLNKEDALELARSILSNFGEEK